MQFEYDPERLIEEVKKRPSIWDTSNPMQKTIAVRVESWNEIVKEMLQPNETVSKGAMRELVLQLQKKWKGVKDAYYKYLQNPNRTKRPYLYCKHLHFLLKNKPPIHPSLVDILSNISASSDKEDSNDADEPIAKKSRLRSTIKVKEDEEDDDQDDHSADNHSADEAQVEDSDDEPKEQNSKHEFTFASVDSNSKAPDTSGDDCDKMFLMSLLPHLKSIPEPHRLNAKCELLQVLKKANVENRW